jgi:hypothetical protein
MKKRNKGFPEGARISGLPVSWQQPQDQRAELVEQILALSTEDRKFVLQRVGALDLSNHLSSDIRVYDKGKDGLKPNSCYVFADGTEGESVDIIETVKANPLSIADPRILHALRRWIYLSRYRAILRKLERYTDSELGDIAANNIEKLCDAIRKSASPLSGDLFEEAVYAMGAISFRPVLYYAWSLLYTKEIQFVSHGENEDGKPSRSRRDKANKLKMLRPFLQRVCHDNSPALNLQTRYISRRYMEVILEYSADEIPQVFVRQERGQPFRVSVNSTVGYCAAVRRWELLLPTSSNYREWISIGQLMKKRGKRCSKGQRLSLNEIITEAGYKLPSRNLLQYPSQRKRAALMGLNEIVLSEPQQHPDNPHSYFQEYLYKRINLEDAPALLNKTKVDVVIDFLKEMDERFLSRKPQFRTFCKRFITWLSGTTEDAVKKSRQRARKQDLEKGELVLDSYNPPRWLDVNFLLPDVLNEYHFTEIPDWLSMPTQLANKK